MAYKIETARIAPGGLNLIAPGDAILETDCLDLMGVWPGSAGRLEVAPTDLHISGAAAMNVACESNGRIFSGGGYALYKDGSSVESGYDGYTLGLLSYQGYCFVINRNKARKHDGVTVSDWTPAAPVAPVIEDGGVDGSGLTPPSDNPPLVGTLLDIPYTYYVTWVTPLGETNPSVAAVKTPAVTGSILRIHQPTPVEPTGIATGWNIYRLVGATPYLLNEDGPLGLDRAYVDDYGDEIHMHSDTQMLELGIIMESDHDAPPPARIMANEVFNGRIVVASSEAHPNRIWYTQPLQPGFFRGSSDPFAGDWLDVGTDSGDEILAMTVRPNLVIIYRAKSIWRHAGDFGDPNARLEPVIPDMGITGPRAVCSTSLGDYFRGPQGIYRFNMDWAQKISSKVEPLFRGREPENFLAETDPSKCALGIENGRLWVSYQQETLKGQLVYHIESDRWFRGTAGYSAYAPYRWGLLGCGLGVFQINGGYGITGNSLGFQSAYHDCNLPDHEKTWADLVLSHNTSEKTFTITIRTNKNANPDTDEFTLATINSSSLTKQIIPLVYPADYAITTLRGQPIRAYNLSVRITGTSIPAGAVIESPILLHYYLEARKALAFDTDEWDHGIQGVKEVDQVELDIDTPDGTAQMQPYSDIPGGTMAQRALEGIVQTTGRQSVRLVLQAPIDGKLLRYTVYSPTAFNLYGMRARILPIGVYLDGQSGEFWQPQPISIGI